MLLFSTENPVLSKVSTMPPIRPKGGSVYVYKLQNSTEKRIATLLQFDFHTFTVELAVFEVTRDATNMFGTNKAPVPYLDPKN